VTSALVSNISGFRVLSALVNITYIPTESSLGPMDFVDPSQTTFIGGFNVHSPSI
jgi:hypothetical protein